MIELIKLDSYRNLTCNILLSGKDLLVAPNGSGKTNLLEAIYHTATGQSFKTLQTNRELIGDGAEFARAELQLSGAVQIVNLVKAEGVSASRQLYLNDKKTSQLAISKRITPVLFAPHSVDIVGGDPQGRRTDLDVYLSAVSPDYRAALKSYTKVLKNRNALLKNVREGYSDPSELNYWNNQLLDLSERLVTARLQFFADIEPYLRQSAEKIYSRDEPLSLHYASKHGSESSASYVEHMQAKMFERQRLEIESGQTLYGPHKDDYELHLQDKPLRYFGSRGQQRISVFAWKYAQILYHLDLNPEREIIFLVDDLLSELDASHKENIGRFMHEELSVQWILTGADEKDLSDSLKLSSRISLK